MKIKKHIQKHKIFYSAILILFCFSGIVFALKELQVTFTFSNIYKLHNGIQLYSQNNIIDTPLYFYLANAFLSMVGFNFFSYKIFAIIIFEIIFLLSLNILRKLKVPTKRAVLYIILIIIPFSKNFCHSGVNYNVLGLMFWLLGMYLIVRKEDLEINPLEQGVISALIFATKQNIGIYYLIGLSIFIIYKYRKNIKNILKKLICTYLFFVLVTLIWVFVLILQGQFKDFINYAFLGLGEFANRNIIFDSEYIIFYSIPFLTLIGLIFIKRKLNLTHENKFIRNTIFFLCFMFPSLFMGYPIFNETHIVLATFISIIYCIYCIEQLVIKFKELFNLKVVKIILSLYLIILVGINMYYIYDYFNMILAKDYKYTYNQPFFGTYVTEEMDNKIKEIVNFVKEKELNNERVIIFSSEANIYQLVLNGNNQDFDMPLLGNWGYKGEERVLNKIKSLENTYFLINDEDITGQESKLIKSYIRDKYAKIDEISGFEVYYINNK